MASAKTDERKNNDPEDLTAELLTTLFHIHLSFAKIGVKGSRAPPQQRGGVVDSTDAVSLFADRPLWRTGAGRAVSINLANFRRDAPRGAGNGPEAACPLL